MTFQLPDPNRAMPYSYIIRQPNLSVASYEAFKSIERKYKRVDQGTDVVSLINACMNDIPEDVRGAKIALKGANFVGTGLIQKPDGKTVQLIGEYFGGGTPNMTMLQCKGIEAIDTGYGTYLQLENMKVYCNEAVGALVDCREVVPRLKDVILDCAGLATCGLHTQPKANETAPVLDRVRIKYSRGLGAYLGQDWLSIPTYLEIIFSNTVEVTHAVLSIGGLSPVTAYSSGVLTGIDAGLIHLMSPSNDPAYGIKSGGHPTFISTLDFEGVVATTCLIWNMYGALTIGSRSRGTSDKMLNVTDYHSQFVRVLHGDQRTLASKIDLVTPTAWTAGVPSEEISCYCYIPSGTTLASGITTYDLYNKWTCNSYTIIQIRPQGTLPTGINVKGVYDRSGTVANQLRIVIDNTTGAGFELTEDAIFWLKLC